jgi:hypothetical protein
VTDFADHAARGQRFGQALVVVLLVLHVLLGLWAIVGLLEWFLPAVPWRRVSNPLFPPLVLLLQWLFILLAAVTFILGYAFRWRRTPEGMAIAYGAMASLCAVETFWFLQHGGRFLDMIIEYLEYLAVLAFLFRASVMRRRFGRDAKPL